MPETSTYKPLSGNVPVDTPIVPGEYQNTGMDRWVYAKRASALRNESMLWTPTWRELSQYENPTRGFFYETRPNVGKKIDHTVLINSCAEDDFDTLSAGMLSGLTSPSRPWVRPELDTDDKDLMEYSPVKEWLDKLQKWLLDTYAKSNVYGSLSSIYSELGTFGTSCSFLQEDYKDVIRLRVYTIGEYSIGNGPDGRANAFYHRFWMTTAQMVKEFGIENCSPQVVASYRNNAPDQWRVVNHLVEENDDRIIPYVDYRHMAHRSIYWEDGAMADCYLRLGGYEEFPLLCPRWATTTTADSYGKGPGWKMLGDVKMLQRLEKDELIAISKVARPPVQVDASVQGEVNMAADGVTRFSALLPNAGVKPAYQVNPDIAAIDAKIAKVEGRIHKKSFAELFLMLIDAERTGRNVTATEIMEKQSEKMSVLGPVLERTESELLNPMNDRTIEIGFRNGVAPLPPLEVQKLIGGMKIKFRYISVLAQAQRMAGITAIEQWRQGVESSVEINPECIDIINYDELNADKGEMLGVPAKGVNDPGTIAMKRKARADAQAKAAQAQAALNASNVAKNAGSAIGSVAGAAENPALSSILSGITGKVSP